jgi:predicted anti-sigma-YlaC factor YlaD
MRCDQSQVLLSARQDGEATIDELALLERHLASCPDCRHRAVAMDGLDRVVRLQPADAVPDLTSAIMAAVPDAVDPRLSAARWSLVVVALAQIVLALPSLFVGGSGDATHATRELGSWSIALAIGLLVAAWQPARARGMVPLGAALVAVLAVGALVDVASGAAAGAAEALHLLEVAGVGLLWHLARVDDGGLRRPALAR